jgi:hypothetical protein
MNDYGTNLSEAFASEVILQYYESSVAEKITNNDYEGEIRDKGSKLNILTFGAVSLRTYSGSNMATVSDPQESMATLTVDQGKAYYFKIGSYARFKSFIKNPEGTLIQNAKNQLAAAVDAYVLGLYGDAGAGNRFGTDFTTGTCTVAVTTGVVTHSATGFTAAMEGKGFKAVGMTKWYRVYHYTSTSQIEIIDDSDDNVAAYSGPAVQAGTAFTIQGLTSIQTTKDLIYTHLVDAATMLNVNQVPKDNRWVVVPAEIAALIRLSPTFIPALETAYNDVVKAGLIGNLAGFTVYENQQVTGNSTDGWHCLFGHKSAITFALGFVESGIEDLTANFGKAYKGLTVYGAKVVDERRKCLGDLFVKL